MKVVVWLSAKEGVKERRAGKKWRARGSCECAAQMGNVRHRQFGHGSETSKIWLSRPPNVSPCSLLTYAQSITWHYICSSLIGSWPAHRLIEASTMFCPISLRFPDKSLFCDSRKALTWHGQTPGEAWSWRSKYCEAIKPCPICVSSRLDKRRQSQIREDSIWQQSNIGNCSRFLSGKFLDRILSWSEVFGLVAVSQHFTSSQYSFPKMRWRG